MTAPGLTSAEIKAVRVWAEPIGSIVEAWLFGSRAKGTARPDSDYDIAVVLASPDDGWNWAAGNYLALGKRWRMALQASLGRHVSLEMIGSGEELAEASGGPSLMIWRRPQAGNGDQ